MLILVHERVLVNKKIEIVRVEFEVSILSVSEKEGNKKDSISGRGAVADGSAVAAALGLVRSLRRRGVHAR